MKRMIWILFTLTLLCLYTTASAWTENPLPDSIKNTFHTGQTILDQTDLTGYGQDDCWFVLAKNTSGEITLYQFKQKNGAWKEQYHTSAAVPQTRNRLDIHIACSGEEWPTDEPFDQPHLYISQIDKENEYTELCITFELTGSRWMLHRVWSYTSYASMLIKEGSISYYHDIESSTIIGTVHGDFQRDLRYFTLSALPKTLQEARKKITAAPDLPASSELIAEKVNFTGGRKYAVYSAPDEHSLRSGKGKAAVSTNGWIQVFGQEGGWVLVQYSIDSEHYRFGYISAKSLPRKANVKQLYFRQAAFCTADTVSVTDDPLYSNAVLTTLPIGSIVLKLADMGEWTYIEYAGDADLQRLRGFVPASSLTQLSCEQVRLYAVEALLVSAPYGESQEMTQEALLTSASDTSFDPSDGMWSVSFDNGQGFACTVLVDDHTGAAWVESEGNG